MKPLRVVVAGTAFGRIYLDAVRSAPGSFTLAGILAKGGQYSRDLAERLDVPLYTEDRQVPDDVDIACVVLRSGATGGEGSTIAERFLRRGIHVLQEHPVHVDEIAGLLRAAKQGNAAYAVNTLYPNLAPVRRFLDAAAVLRGRHRLSYVDAACNSQVAYPLIDVLGKLAGTLRPWAFGAEQAVDETVAAVAAGAQPFRVLHAVVGGLPTTLRVQNEVHPEDPDNHSLLMHRISVGCEAGVLTLADTHGPVLWQPRLHSPRDETGRLVMSGPGTERLAVPSTSVLGDEPGTFHDVFARLWPDAVVTALHGLRADIGNPRRRLHSGQWALGVSKAWSELTGQLGLPALIRPPEPGIVSIGELAGAR